MPEENKPVEEPAKEEGKPEAGKEPAKEPTEEKPPWGSDDEFDPQRAWKLIQDVRSDADKRKAEAEELRQKVKKHEDASKSDQEKLEERATTAEQRAVKAEKEAARFKVALKKGLTEVQARRLVGDSEEDLAKDADELLASFKGSENEESQRRPRENLRPGAAPSSEPEENDPKKLAESVPRMY